LTEVQRILISERISGTRQQIVDQQGWGVILFQMETLVRSLRSLPLTTVFTCQEREDTNQIGPDLSGQIGRSIARHLDILARVTLFEKEEEKDGKKVVKQVRKLRLRRQLSPPVEAKCRYWNLPDWADCDITAILKQTAENKGE
jgi:hypothetical protein